jgi:hypothetical protein
MSVQTDAPGATEDARDPWQAALEQVNAEQGFDPAAAGSQPVPAGDAPTTGLTGTDDGRDTPTGATPGAPTTAALPEVSPELDRLRKQYAANLEQQRAHFAQREAEAEARGRAQAAAASEQQAREAAERLVSERAAQRAEVDRRLALTADPDARQQLADYRAQLDQADSAHYQAELTRERERATTAEQAAQQVVYRAQTERVAALLPQLLPQYAPHIALALAQRGQEATEDEVRAILAKPEYIREAQAATYQGKQAMDIFGQVLTTAVGNELSMARQHAQQQAQGRRAERDASGLGRAAQAGNGAGEPPEDLNQYKSAPDKAGDWDKMLAALNKRQNIPTAPGERR